MTTSIWRRVITILASTAAITTAGSGIANADDPVVPVEGTDSAQAVEGQYIVVMRPGAEAAAARARAIAEARSNGALISAEYSNALNGFAATLPARALEVLRRNAEIAFIEVDQLVTLSDTQSPATQGLDRVDQRNLPLTNSYTFNFTGAGVTAYIIDTGVRFSHNEFGGRAISGFDAIDGGSADDCNGHGTHVAGTTGGALYGVAKAVQVVGVRVLNCNGSGTNSQVISGVDWVTGEHSAGERAVANMSLGGGASNALDTAVRNSIADGITYALAAGNDNRNACNQSPARVAEAITVGSSTVADARSSFSNFGTCVDIFAPGSSIKSAWNSTDTATRIISGTSMASPHVAGAAALYVQQNPSASPQAVRDALVASATAGALSNVGAGSPNLLLYTLGGSAPPPGCGGLPEQFNGSLSGSGDADFIPNSAGFSANAGTLRGCLDGPAGANFNLSLFRNDGSRWVRVAVSQGSTADESVTYAATAGTYRWRVYSTSGSGSYNFAMQRP